MYVPSHNLPHDYLVQTWADALRSSVHWTSVTLITSTTRYPCMYACQTLLNSEENYAGHRGP